MSDNLPTPELDRRALLWLWRVSVATPAFYMLISVIVKSALFEAGEPPGFWRVSPEAWRVVQALVALLAIVGVGALLRMRHARAGRPLAEYRRTTFVMLVVSDLTAFVGLAMYLVQGDVNAQAALTLLAWVNYAVARPAGKA